MNNTMSLWLNGWVDNSTTNHREYYHDGVKGRHGHRSGISPDSPHEGFREPWGYWPDVQHKSQAA